MIPIRRVGVVGSGAMGAGIAEVSALAGMDVLVAVSRESSLTTGRRRVAGSLDRAVAKGRIGEADRDAALARLRFTTDLGELADRQLVVEAVREEESLKLDLFATLDKVVEDPEAILASNTSSIPVMKLAGATGRPAQVIGTHFFNPVPAMALVELVGSLHTSEATLDRAETWVAETLGKQPIRAKDRAGFVVNALLVPYLLSAVRMLETGFATAEDIDRGMVLGCSHPMGPLRLTDMVGLDIVAAVADALYAEFKEPLYAAPPLLSRMVEGGLLGRKTGRGFYSYA
ncbi:3-hydroxybutyryl-CoA dehydrogenase [Streptomyces sp. NPDC046727]|uniref:3-hydroxybutyryl-CoA dehydrogenase n=1 Tax=Streptomyces sp. NPDC046727 TaxID=3155373 RepID=UPI0033F97E56